MEAHTNTWSSKRQHILAVVPAIRHSQGFNEYHTTMLQETCIYTIILDMSRQTILLINATMRVLLQITLSNFSYYNFVRQYWKCLIASVVHHHFLISLASFMNSNEVFTTYSCVVKPQSVLHYHSH